MQFIQCYETGRSSNWLKNESSVKKCNLKGDAKNSVEKSAIWRKLGDISRNGRSVPQLITQREKKCIVHASRTRGRLPNFFQGKGGRGRDIQTSPRGIYVSHFLRIQLALN